MQALVEVVDTAQVESSEAQAITELPGTDLSFVGGGLAVVFY